jgi:hypothetical protein
MENSRSALTAARSQQDQNNHQARHDVNTNYVYNGAVPSHALSSDNRSPGTIPISFHRTGEHHARSECF